MTSLDVETAPACSAAPERTARVAGHFGEWLQGRHGPDGPVVLVTLACGSVATTVRRRPAPTLVLDGTLASLLTPARARAFLKAVGGEPAGAFHAATENGLGRGTGASTAALLALARAAGSAAAPDALASACLAAEGATDPLMFAAPDGVLWASRRAEVAASLTPPPRFDVVGGFFGAGEPTDPLDDAFPDIADLVDRWRAATSRPDRAELAAVASLSAERTTALRGPSGDPTARLARELGALGHARAHTGSARAFLFAPGTVPEGADEALLRSGLADVRRFTTGADV